MILRISSWFAIFSGEGLSHSAKRDADDPLRWSVCSQHQTQIPDVIRAALDALRLQFSLFDLESLTTTYERIKWRERVKKSFGYDPLQCPRCGRTLKLAEIWEPKRGHIWMKR